jgi:hypothetical protein
MRSVAPAETPSSPKERISNYLARKALTHDVLERALVAACRRPSVGQRLHLGSVALAYSRVLSKPEVRLAEFERYKM